jgi:hypothetical protein
VRSRTAPPGCGALTRPLRCGCAPRAAQEITRLINERNEADYARKATQSGGSLTVVRRGRGGAAARRAAAAAPALTRRRAAAYQLRPPPDAQVKAKAKAKPSVKAGVLGKH